MSSLHVRSLVLLFGLASCVSERVAFPTLPMQPEEQICGRVDGMAGGFMLFDLIPLGQNDRFKRAYVSACEQANAGSRLVNVQCWESWFWAVVGCGYVFHVSADCVWAIDPAKRPKVEAPQAPKPSETQKEKDKFDLLRRHG